MMEFKELDNASDLATQIGRNITELMQYCQRLEEVIEAENKNKEKLEVEVKHQKELVEKTQIRVEDHKKSYEGFQGVSHVTLKHLMDEEMKWTSEQQKLNNLEIQMKKTVEEKQNYYNTLLVELGDHLVDPAVLEKAKEVKKMKSDIERLEGIMRERRKDIFTKQQEKKYHVNKLIVEMASGILTVRKEEKKLEEMQSKKKSAKKCLEELKEKINKALREQEMSKTTKALSNETSAKQSKVAWRSSSIMKYSTAFARNVICSAPTSPTSTIPTTQCSEAPTKKTEKPGKFNFNRFQLCMKGSSSQNKTLQGATRPLSHFKSTPGRSSPLARGFKSPMYSPRPITHEPRSNSPVIPRSWHSLSRNFTKPQSLSSPMNVYGKNSRKETSCVNVCEKEDDTGNLPKVQTAEQTFDVTSAQGTKEPKAKNNSLMGTIQEEETMDQMETEDEQSQSQELIPSQGFNVSQAEELQHTEISHHKMESQNSHQCLSTADTSEPIEQANKSLPNISDGAILKKAPNNSQDIDMDQEVWKGDLQDTNNFSSLNTNIGNVHDQSSQELELNSSNDKFTNSSSVMECENDILPQDADLNYKSAQSSESSSSETANHSYRNDDPVSQCPPTSDSATNLEKTNNVLNKAQDSLQMKDSQRSINSESRASSFSKKPINPESIVTSCSRMSLNSEGELHTPSLEKVKRSDIVQEHGTSIHSQKCQSPVTSQSESAKGTTHLSPLFKDSSCKVVSSPSTFPAADFSFKLGNVEGNQTPDFSLNFGGSFDKQQDPVGNVLDLFASPGESDTSKSDAVNFSLFESCSSQETSQPRNQFSFNLSGSENAAPSQPFFSLFGGDDMYSTNTSSEETRSKFCLF
ncbi:uncharacterized protein LOC143040400 [Oratosquilla oratoria]|uniref:uncharacterized protein LOC143040400 n=1 Tax=Oratosquilla oratoria TaxID=337810 RepID=UPI003F76FB2F